MSRDAGRALDSARVVGRSAALSARDRAVAGHRRRRTVPLARRSTRGASSRSSGWRGVCLLDRCRSEPDRTTAPLARALERCRAPSRAPLGRSSRSKDRSEALTLHPAPGALLVGAGTGSRRFAPSFTMRSGRTRRRAVVLVAGNRTSRDLLWHAELARWRANIRGFVYEPVVSQPDASFARPARATSRNT